MPDTMEAWSDLITLPDYRNETEFRNISMRRLLSFDDIPWFKENFIPIVLQVLTKLRLRLATKYAKKEVYYDRYSAKMSDRFNREQVKIRQKVKQEMKNLSADTLTTKAAVMFKRHKNYINIRAKIVNYKHTCRGHARGIKEIEEFAPIRVDLPLPLWTTNDKELMLILVNAVRFYKTHLWQESLERIDPELITEPITNRTIRRDQGFYVTERWLKAPKMKRKGMLCKISQGSSRTQDWAPYKRILYERRCKIIRQTQSRKIDV